MEENNLVDFIVEARKYKTTLTTKYMDRKAWKKPYEGDVVSLLPGTVLSIETQVGNVVRVGDLLMIHEAMKMQNRILAPIDGIIAEIIVKEGDKIGKNHLMIKIQPKNTL